MRRLFLTDSLNCFCHITKNLIRLRVFVVLLDRSYRRKEAIFRTPGVVYPLSSRLTALPARDVHMLERATSFLCRFGEFLAVFLRTTFFFFLGDCLLLHTSSPVKSGSTRVRAGIRLKSRSKLTICLRRKLSTSTA